MACVGDVLIDRPDHAVAFDHVAPLIAAADLSFANCEAALSSSQLSPASLPISSKPEHAQTLAKTGFHVMSLANNHAANAGGQGIADTRAALGRFNIGTVGAGGNLAEAQAPLVIERGGQKVAFLAYSSIFLPGDVARTDRPGISVLRSHSYYYFNEVWSKTGVVIPGEDPRVGTVPYPEDVQMLQLAIADARKLADIVIVSHHSGISTKKGYLADYERLYAHAAIDAGADIVLGHHHHFLRGVELYNGRPIVYGLGIFMLDLPRVFAKTAPEELERMRREGCDTYAMYPRAGYPLLPPFHPDCRYTMIAVFDFDGRMLNRVGLVPCYLNERGEPEPHPLDSPIGQAVHKYLVEITEAGALNARYEAGGPKLNGFESFAVLPA
ncbi:CapA family protein [Devosia riboflavina]|nr:CapA family protein [Devosia riboflavina]